MLLLSAGCEASIAPSVSATLRPRFRGGFGWQATSCGLTPNEKGVGCPPKPWRRGLLPNILRERHGAAFAVGLGVDVQRFAVARVIARPGCFPA